MPRLPKVTTKKVAKRNESDYIKRQKEITKRSRDKNAKELKALKETERTKRYIDKQQNRTKRVTAGAKTKTVARSSATASAAVSANLSGIEQARYNAEAAKYDALITGNIYGENAVDKSKTGGDGNSNPLDNNQNKKDYYGGW